jgi:hypothetical protein
MKVTTLKHSFSLSIYIEAYLGYILEPCVAIWKKILFLSFGQILAIENL